MSKAKPFLKWAGGKSRIANKVVSFFPDKFDRYYEPFLGSGAIYFTISPQKGVLNDLNKYLIGAYETIRDRPHELIKKLSIIDHEYHSLPSLEAKANYYYEKRSVYNTMRKTSTNKSALFIFLNKAGYNGMYRENRKGEYNIPFGKHERCLICDKDNIIKVSKDLADIKLISGDYKKALSTVKKGDLIYLDPPYIPLSKTSNFTQYQKEGFGGEEHLKLKNIALKLHKIGCKVVISNSYCEESINLYNDKIFYINKISVIRQIHASRKVVPEIVVTNFKVKGSS